MVEGKGVGLGIGFIWLMGLIGFLHFFDFREEQILLFLTTKPKLVILTRPVHIQCALEPILP